MAQEASQKNKLGDVSYARKWQSIKTSMKKSVHDITFLIFNLGQPLIKNMEAVL